MCLCVCCATATNLNDGDSEWRAACLFECQHSRAICRTRATQITAYLLCQPEHCLVSCSSVVIVARLSGWPRLRRRRRRRLAPLFVYVTSFEGRSSACLVSCPVPVGIISSTSIFVPYAISESAPTTWRRRHTPSCRRKCVTHARLRCVCACKL